ncbi:hypothetical protein POTOM_029058 [Populus tomentosa]|uniref:Uncharacterized protein n=1 Tax=Populus tomentosa TaxID=118781 RepID=A0A8X7Z8A1_POPTO|nr:hypothetical protein POTOM_029058 [Populus tomentosa]
MHRSASGTRASDDFLISLAPAADVYPLKNTAYSELPTQDPISDVTKKDLAWHHKSMGENAIHLIPVVLILFMKIPIRVFLESIPSWRNKMEVQEMNACHEHDKGEDKLDLNFDY